MRDSASSETKARSQDVPHGFLDRSRRKLVAFEALPITSRQVNAVLASLAALYLAITALWSLHQLWHDEIYTYYIAKSPTLFRMWHYLHLDLNPPISYLAVRASLSVLGDNSYATRFPSIIGLLVASACLYVFVSSRIRRAYGVLAVLVFWSTPFLTYATEARPYAIVTGFFGLALLAWDSARRPERSGLSLLLLGLAVTAMMMSHFFGLFYLAPFCLAELIRTYQSRKIDWAMWIVLVIPAVLLLLYIPLVSRFQSSEFPAIFQASPRKLFTFLYYTLYPGIVAIVIACATGIATAYLIRKQTGRAVSLPRAIDVAFTAGLFLIPAIIIAVLARTHGAFFPRYGAPAVLGYGIVLAYAVAKSTNASRVAAAAASILLFLYIASVDLLASGRDFLETRNNDGVAQSKKLEPIYPNLPLVAASGLTFLEMDRYSSPAIVKRFYYLTDGQFAVQYAHASIFEILTKLKNEFPIRSHVVPYRSFAKEHREFLVLGTKAYAEDWLLPRLLDVKAQVKLIGEISGPYKDHELYQVILPDQAER